MNEHEQKKRLPPLSIRLSAEERAELERRAEMLGISPHAYAKSRLFDTPPPRRPRRPPLEARLIVQFLAAAARVQDQLHDVAQAGGADHALALEQARDELIEIRAALMKALGR